MAANLFNGRRIKTLTVIDNCSREWLAIMVDHLLRGSEVVATIEYVEALRGKPTRIQVDNGEELTKLENSNLQLSQ